MGLPHHSRCKANWSRSARKFVKTFDGARGPYEALAAPFGETGAAGGTIVPRRRWSTCHNKESLMASAPPDPHPDSLPTGPEQIPEQVPLPGDDGRESIEDVPETE
ncbi:hypothetical protein LH19_21635 [Sphingopyxis macrogoltabida]|nr:hypothetical protein LH19_21635 [Sphingopyxis macrogoltabida]